MSRSTHLSSADGFPPNPASWSRTQWDEFLRRHRRPFYQIVSRNPGLRREHHDEVYTDTCSAIWEARDRLDPNRPVFSYAYRIAVNMTRTKVRELSSAKRVCTRRLTNDEALMDCHRTGAEQASVNETQLSVQKYLDGLTPTDRAILVSRGLHREKWDAVAAKTGMPRTTVIRKYEAIIADARISLAHLAN
jgi:RNA polymerase sigma factor (sigma-70 family)